MSGDRMGGRRSNTSCKAPLRLRLRMLAACHCRADEGAATAEFAVVLPVVAALAALLLCLSRTVIVTMDCQDAASSVVRELVAYGVDAEPRAAARAVAGDGSAVDVRYEGDRVTATVQCPVIPDPLGVLPTAVRGTATGILP